MTGHQLRDRFADLFTRVRYLEWFDSVPPLVGISGDLGWMLVRIHARRVSANGTRLPDFDAAWIAVYERAGGQWTLRAISSSVVETP